MLPPIPHSLVPVTATQDVIKPRPEIPPVTTAEGSAKESELSLDKRHPPVSYTHLTLPTKA